ncbi:MAG: HEAT repeat domain-containing protein [Planctomycetes bacterium]|nr:HEAT repeat domain-containing protein [Planctomycetota bacterium]
MSAAHKLLAAAVAALAIAAFAHHRPAAAPTGVQPQAVAAASAGDNVTATSPERTRSDHGGYAAVAGTRMHYRLDLQQSLALQPTAPDQAAARPFASHAVGTLRVTVLDRRDGELLVEHVSPDLRIEVVGDADGATMPWAKGLATAMAAGFTVRMDQDGRPRALRFPAGWSAEQRNWARALHATFAFELASADAWERDAVDAMGSHRFGYRRVPGAGDHRVERTRTVFTPHGVDDIAKARVHHAGSTTASFADGWLAAGSAREDLAWTMVDGSLRLQTAIEASLERQRVEVVAVAADWTGDWSPVSGQHERSLTATQQLQADWDRRLQGLDLPTIVQRLQALHAQGQGHGRDHMELVWALGKLVQREPALAARIAALVHGAALPESSAASLLSALGMAGHDLAQAALAQVFENGLVPAGLRQVAVESMFQVEHPSAALVASVQRNLQGRTQLAALDQSAMLALGAFAAAGARTAEGQSLALELLRLEAAARASGADGCWSEALGNTGDAALLPVARRLLASSDPNERQRALTIVRRMELPAGRELLIATVRSDGNADVRRHGVDLAGECQEGWASELLAERAAGDADVEVRRAAITALGTRRATDASARAALARLSGSERDPTLLALLQQVRQE